MRSATRDRRKLIAISSSPRRAEDRTGTRSAQETCLNSLSGRCKEPPIDWNCTVPSDKDKALTQKDLAEMVGLNQAQIHPYEQGAAEPSMSALKRLALGP
jgi:hypothetical protein